MGLPAADLARLSTLLDEADGLAPSALESWLAGLEGESARLGPALRELLARQGSKETDDLLEHPPVFTLPAAGPAAGDTVGPYLLLSELGTGGMGTVWLAERVDGSVKRKVALKLPHLSWAPGLGVWAADATEPGRWWQRRWPEGICGINGHLGRRARS